MPSENLATRKARGVDLEQSKGPYSQLNGIETMSIALDKTKDPIPNPTGDEAA